MKNKFLFLILICACLTSAQGCKKDDSQNPTQTINVSISSNQTYQYDLGSFGDEEGAEITKQASHFLISKTERVIESGKTLYTYIPELNYEGSDVVEIKTERGSDGASPSTTITTIIIKFTVTK